MRADTRPQQRSPNFPWAHPIRLFGLELAGASVDNWARWDVEGLRLDGLLPLPVPPKDAVRHG